MKDWLATAGVPGRVRYYGCPAEEGGAAKGFMVRAGAFDDVDIAISWHPAAFWGVNEPRSLANTRIDFTFTGRASHAAASPHLGRTALDAVELMSVGVNYMREHMPSDARIHYAILDAGGIAPNVVQARAKVRYLIRARDLPELTPLVARVRKVADGAALMTETTVTARVISAVSNLLGNTPLERALHDNLRTPWPAAVRRRRPRLRRPDPGDVERAGHRERLPPRRRAAAPGRRLGDVAVPLDAPAEPMVGSTDVGDVSWMVPTVQARGATYAIGTPGHSWQLTAQGKTPAAHKGMLHVAKAMAATAVDAMTDPALLARAKADHAAKLTATPYVCPLPEGIDPPIDMSRAT